MLFHGYNVSVMNEFWNRWWYNIVHGMTTTTVYFKVEMANLVFYVFYHNKKGKNNQVPLVQLRNSDFKKNNNTCCVQRLYRP